MLIGIFSLIGCQLLGEVIVSVLGLTVPGSIIGMILLFIFILIRGAIPKGVDAVGNGLLKYIGLLFVPAGAGISMFLRLIVEKWDIVLIVSVTSTILTLIVCVGFFQLFSKER